MFFRSLVLPMDDTNVAGAMMRMLSMSLTFNYSFESTVWAWSVFDHSMGSISFFQRVSTSKMFTISVLMLVFYIVSMRIMNSIFKFVMTLENRWKKVWCRFTWVFQTHDNVGPCFYMHKTYVIMMRVSKGDCYNSEK